MITIKAPIELKLRTDLMRGSDSFGERIAGNYSLIGLEIGEEELLHMVSSPPEIYLADGGSTTIGGNTFISSRNEEKYNIVNNMLNRILLSVNGELTYQDRTYITDTLHKLGIKDDRKFMNEVKTMIEESHLEENFLNHYFELVLEGENRELRERTLELTKELTERESYSTEQMSENYLSERILHRLRTGAIYQIVSNFNKSLSDTRIELQESMLSEQENVARKLLVQNFVSSVIREEPELFHRTEGREGPEAGETEIIREVQGRQAEGPGETVREERSTVTERMDREVRESQQYLNERERSLLTERETAEIVYRKEGGEEAAPSAMPGAPEERVIRDEQRIQEPGSTELRTTEQIRTEKERPAAAGSRGEEIITPAAGERVVTEAGTSERLTERITEAGGSVTERHDSDHVLERSERYVTEQGEVLRTEHDQSELVYREGESRESYEEALLERLTDRVTEEKDRVTENRETEYRSTERIGTEPGTGLRTERVTSEILSREERERILSGEEVPGKITERFTEEGARITERRDHELLTERTNRYVTETGEILRTEHEGAEIVYHEQTLAAGPEEMIPQSLGAIQNVPVTERERIREPGETVISEQRIPGQPGERITESSSRITERIGTEYRTSESRIEEQSSLLQREKERTELLREAEKESAELRETIRERSREQLISERTESSELTEKEQRTDRYVTELSEVQRTEHEGADIVYREETAVPGTEDVSSQASVTVRGDVVNEREIIREPGSTTVYEQRVQGQAGEVIPGNDIRVSERSESELRIEESRLTELNSVLQTGKDREELLHEIERKNTELKESFDDRSRESLITDRSESTERTESELIKDRYVTELGEILRTEHEGEKLIYREGQPAEGSEEMIPQSPGTIHEVSVTERERIIKPGETVISEQQIPGQPGERITEGSSRVTERLDTEYRTSESRTSEQNTLLQREKERTELLREAEKERTELRDTINERLREQLISERTESTERTETGLRTESTESYVTELGEILHTEHEGAELIHRENVVTEEEAGASGESRILRETLETERERLSERERLERERSSRETREATVSAVRDELREQIRTERIRTEQAMAGVAPAAGRTYESPEMVYRREGAKEGAAAEEQRPAVSTREVMSFRSDNIYERELLEKEKTRTEVTAGLTAAVLLDVVKTLFHAGYEKLGKGDTWIEYRGAIYHSADNIFQRLNYDLDEEVFTQNNEYREYSGDVELDLSDYTELEEITENNQEFQQIENTIREMNEMNLQNVERYQQMVQMLKEIRPEKRRPGGGIERTRQEALSLMDDEQALYESLKVAESEQEDQRREIFHEITRLFPDNSVKVFRLLEQYLEGNAAPGRANVSRNNVEAAAEEIRRITSIPAVTAEPVTEISEMESSELIFRREDRMTQEEVQEMVENLRRTEQLQRREIEQRQEQLETERRNTFSTTTTTQRTLSRQEAEDIEALVSRGVRAQMGAISEQVLQKLEKKLRNEKIRRGI